MKRACESVRQYCFLSFHSLFVSKKALHLHFDPGKVMSSYLRILSPSLALYSCRARDLCNTCIVHLSEATGISIFKFKLIKSKGKPPKSNLKQQKKKLRKFNKLISFIYNFSIVYNIYCNSLWSIFRKEDFWRFVIAFQFVVDCSSMIMQKSLLEVAFNSELHDVSWTFFVCHLIKPNR